VGAAVSLAALAMVAGLAIVAMVADGAAPAGATRVCACWTCLRAAARRSTVGAADVSDPCSLAVLGQVVEVDAHAGVTLHRTTAAQEHRLLGKLRSLEGSIDKATGLVRGGRGREFRVAKGQNLDLVPIEVCCAACCAASPLFLSPRVLYCFRCSKQLGRGFPERCGSRNREKAADYARSDEADLRLKMKCVFGLLEMPQS